jgi:hypothetical protein
LPFFGQNCSLPFFIRSLDIPALLKSWKKHYISIHKILLISQVAHDKHNRRQLCHLTLYLFQLGSKKAARLILQRRVLLLQICVMCCQFSPW